LSKNDKEMYEKKKEKVEKNKELIDDGNEFMKWIRVDKEKIRKC
jgi:hypothetical protein